MAVGSDCREWGRDASVPSFLLSFCHLRENSTSSQLQFSMSNGWFVLIINNLQRFNSHIKHKTLKHDEIWNSFFCPILDNFVPPCKYCLYTLRNIVSDMHVEWLLFLGTNSLWKVVDFYLTLISRCCDIWMRVSSYQVLCKSIEHHIL